MNVNLKSIIFLLFGFVFITGCSPEVGTKEWCNNLSEKPKGDWTINESKDYAKHCLFR